MLTKKQLDLLDYINKRIQRDGVPPSALVQRSGIETLGETPSH